LYSKLLYAQNSKPHNCKKEVLYAHTCNVHNIKSHILTRGSVFWHQTLINFIIFPRQRWLSHIHDFHHCFLSSNSQASNTRTKEFVRGYEIRVVTESLKISYICIFIHCFCQLPCFLQSHCYLFRSFLPWISQMIQWSQFLFICIVILMRKGVWELYIHYQRFEITKKK